ncbi:MAG: glycosyltransferase [Desulfovibrionaceae bacterium]|nr:glycosyltransferase [Desulfovibrionaceae bacterium]MBF0513612.1 glycosyltransferase [Desulfovibrionaceae bacterium]
MSKIYYLNKKQTCIRPVLIILTSHRLDCLILCLRCLEWYTNLDNFKEIYIVCNEVSEEHQAIIGRFLSKHENASKIDCLPRGLVPAVAGALNALLAAHKDDLIVTIDEDVFVTPHWLEHMTEASRAHKNTPRTAAFSPVVPVSPMGREALSRFLRVAYPSQRRMFQGLGVPDNWVYHRWMWEKILEENLAEVYLASHRGRYQTTRSVSFNCLFMTKALLDLILPLPMPGAPEGSLFNHPALSETMQRQGLNAVVASRCLVHHYSHAACEDYLRGRVPLEAVWKFMQSQPARELFRHEILRAADHRATAKLALVRA